MSTPQDDSAGTGYQPRPASAFQALRYYPGGPRITAVKPPPGQQSAGQGSQGVLLEELDLRPPRLLLPMLGRLGVRTVTDLLALDLAAVARCHGVGKKKLRQLEQYTGAIRALIDSGVPLMTREQHAATALSSQIAQHVALDTPWAEVLVTVPGRIRSALEDLSAHTLQDAIDLVCARPELLLEHDNFAHRSLAVLRGYLDALASQGPGAAGVADMPLSELIPAMLATLPDRTRRMIELRAIEGKELVQVGALVGVSRERVRQVVSDMQELLPRLYRTPLERAGQMLDELVQAAGGIMLESELVAQAGICAREARFLARLAGREPLAVYEQHYVCAPGFERALEDVRAQLGTRTYAGATPEELAAWLAERGYPLPAARALELLGIRSRLFKRRDGKIELKTSAAQVLPRVLELHGAPLHWLGIVERIEATYEPGEVLGMGSPDEKLSSKRRRLLVTLTRLSGVQRIGQQTFVHASAALPRALRW